MTGNEAFITKAGIKKNDGAGIIMTKRICCSSDGVTDVETDIQCRETENGGNSL